MKRFLISLIIAIVVIIVATVGYNLMNSKNSESPDPRNNIFKSDLLEKTTETVEETDNNMISLYPIDDDKARAKYSDYVIVGKVENIEKEYFDEEQKTTVTIGTIKVKKVFKGDLKKGAEIPFVRDGGIDDIPIENNKTYLMYLNYNDTLNRYEFRDKSYGLREVDTSHIIWNYEKAKVKNNVTGVYTEIRQVLPAEYIKTRTFLQTVLEAVMHIITKVVE